MEWLYWTNKMGYDVGQLMPVIMATLHFAKFVAMLNFYFIEIGSKIHLPSFQCLQRWQFNIGCIYCLATFLADLESMEIELLDSRVNRKTFGKHKLWMDSIHFEHALFYH